MRRVSYVLALLLCFGLKAFAQETFKSDIFVGYSYERIGFANASAPTFVGYHGNLNGWNAAFDWSPNGRWGITADVSGHYGSPSSIVAFKPQNCVLCTTDVLTTIKSEHLFLFGPRIATRPGKVVVFGHALFGGGHIVSETQTDLPAANFPLPSPSDTSFAMAFGGGVDLGVSHKLAVRVQPDYVLTRFSGASQHNFRLSTGLVFRFGK